jgi:hypothetical protein
MEVCENLTHAVQGNTAGSNSANENLDQTQPTDNEHCVLAPCNKTSLISQPSLYIHHDDSAFRAQVMLSVGWEVHQGCNANTFKTREQPFESLVTLRCMFILLLHLTCVG